MTTQGLLTLTRAGQVVAKVIMGANGNGVPEMARAMRLHPVENHRTGLRLGLLRFCEKWCTDCPLLVIQYGPDDLCIDGRFVNAEGLSLYREKFEDPRFNPQRKNGYVEYYMEVQLARNDTENLIVEDLVADLSDRGSLGSAWDSIDQDIQEEIKGVWADIISSRLQEVQ
jgi:hypothetical protein